MSAGVKLLPLMLLGLAVKNSEVYTALLIWEHEYGEYSYGICPLIINTTNSVHEENYGTLLLILSAFAITELWYATLPRT
jgi:hypothetical protein